MDWNKNWKENRYGESEKIKELIAKKMLEVGALKFGEFILSSGRKSNVYVDVKLACTYPDLLRLLSSEMASLLRNTRFDVVACVELGGVPLAVALSLETGKRTVIFRKKKKSYGLGEDRIGFIRRGERVVVVEDVTTTGSSALSAVERVREAGGEVVAVVTAVDRREGSEENFKKAGVKLIPVLTLDYLRSYGDRNSESEE